MFTRNRRLRTNASIRSLIQETQLTTNDFVLPMFVMEGDNKKEAIASMPGVFRQTLDLTVKQIKENYALGIKAVNIYMKVSDSLKDNTGKEAWNPNGLMQNTIKAIKDAVPEVVVMPDVALDPYSIYGHDGIVKGALDVSSTGADILALFFLSAGFCRSSFVSSHVSVPPYFFLLATVRLGPLQVRALVLVRWPRQGRPLRWRTPR